MKIIPILGVLSWLIFSSAVVPSTSDTTDFGHNIFNALEQNDFEAIKKMMFSIQDMENTVDHSKMNEDQKSKFKASMIEKLQSDWDKTLTTVEKGFNAIREVFDSKKCKKGIVLGKITPKTSVVNDLPFEIGDLTIEFKCGGDTESMNVEIIKTETGWYILEKLRLIYK